MLSRTAENLFWSARYIERADSLARLLEVGYRISLIPNIPARPPEINIAMIIFLMVRLRNKYIWETT